MADLERAQVFVVERDPYASRLIRQFLRNDFTLEFFETGYAALDRIRRSPPEALMTEILIPELDGLALCRLLKGDAATKHVPILVCSMLISAERARVAGADAFVEKPLERMRLLTTVNDLTARKERGGAPSPREQGNG